MSRSLTRRLFWPGIILGLLTLFAVQTEAPGRWLEPAAITSLLCQQPSSRGEASEAPAASETTRITAEGRVVAYPGAEVVVGTEVPGLIVLLPVEEKSIVRKGDLIAELSFADLRASLAEARARVIEAEADERFYDRELKRELDLIARRAGTQQNLHSLRHNLNTSRARRAAARASCGRFEALIDKTRITAPIDGVITARHVHPGETVEAAARIATIVNLDRLRIEAEVDEYDTARVRLGASVTFRAEGYESTWTGRIEEIPDTVVGRRLRPEDPGRPIDARVLPVKIALPERSPLKLGQRVEVVIDSSGKAPKPASSR